MNTINMCNELSDHEIEYAFKALNTLMLVTTLSAIILIIWLFTSNQNVKNIINKIQTKDKQNDLLTLKIDLLITKIDIIEKKNNLITQNINNKFNNLKQVNNDQINGLRQLIIAQVNKPVEYKINSSLLDYKINTSTLGTSISTNPYVSTYTYRIPLATYEKDKQEEKDKKDKEDKERKDKEDKEEKEKKEKEVKDKKEKEDVDNDKEELEESDDTSSELSSYEIVGNNKNLFETLTEAQFKKLYYKTMNKFSKDNTDIKKYKFTIEYIDENEEELDNYSIIIRELNEYNCFAAWLKLDNMINYGSLYCYERIKQVIDKENTTDTNILCEMTLIIDCLMKEFIGMTEGKIYKKNE